MTANFLRLLMISTLVIGCKKDPEPAAAAPKAAKAPIIAPVLFETGSSQIMPSEQDAIDRAAGIMKSTDWDCLVLGLADSTGDIDTNKALSLDRAEAVAAELRRKSSGVPSSRIVTHAIGEKLASGGASVLERKVEFVFFHDEGLPLKEVVVKSRVLEEDFRAAR